MTPLAFISTQLSQWLQPARPISKHNGGRFRTNWRNKRAAERKAKARRKHARQMKVRRNQ